MTRYESTQVRPGGPIELAAGSVATRRDTSEFNVAVIIGFAAFSASYLAAMAWIPWTTRGTAIATAALSLLVSLGVAVVSYQAPSSRDDA